MSGQSRPRVVTVDLDEAQRRIPELWAQIAELTREARGLEAAIELASDPRYGSGCRWDAPSPASQCTTSAEHALVRGPTYREMIKAVLVDQPTGMGVRQMLDAIQARFHVQLDRNSVSSLLRKLADRGELFHDASAAKWAIGKQSAEPETGFGEVVDVRFGVTDEQKEGSGRSAA